MKMLFMFRAQSNWVIFLEGIKGSRFPTSVQLIFLLPGKKKKKSGVKEYRGKSQRAVTAAGSARIEDFLVPMPC